MKSQFITLNNQQFHYLTWGDEAKPTLLLLHGFPEYSGAWNEVAERLSEDYFCVAPDQRGYGQSWAPSDAGEYTASKLIMDAAALIGALGGPVTVVGHDWGAAVAYGLAMFRADLCEKLIIINGVHPAPFQREIAAGGAQTAASQYIHYLRKAGSEDKLAADDFALLTKLFSANMDQSWLSGDTLETYKKEWGREGRLRAMINWYRASPLVVGEVGKPLESPPELPIDKLQVTMPHLLIWGMGDTALLPESNKGLEEFAPDLTRVEIKGGDHWVCHQQPDAVAGAIKDWLAART